MKSITIIDEVKDDYDLVKVKVSWELKMKLNDSDFMHLLLEKDINEIRSQERKILVLSKKEKEINEIRTQERKKKVKK